VGLSATRRAAFFVLIASCAFATASPLARWARPADPVFVACARCLLGALVLGALDVRSVWRDVARATRRQRLLVACVGALLALHFALFLVGLDRTSLAAGISLVSLEPLSVVLFAWGMHRIAPTRLELVGVLTATAGACVVARAAGQGEHRLTGDLLVIGAVVVYGLYVAAARSLKSALPARSYAVSVYLSAAIALAVVLPFVPRGGAIWPLPPHSWLAIVGLAIVPTVIGHTMVQTGSRTLSPSTVALVSPGETIGGMAISMAFMSAHPLPLELIGAVVVLVGATLAIFGARPIVEA
jgi:drug/metabolite transporter (DMT)-like permease